MDNVCVYSTVQETVRLIKLFNTLQEFANLKL